MQQLTQFELKHNARKFAPEDSRFGGEMNCGQKVISNTCVFWCCAC